MSHVAIIELDITDLDCLQAACLRIGLEFHRDQKSYRWYGESYGDYPLPDGFSADDLGKCDHSLSVAGNRKAYEIGVCRSRRQGQQGKYDLLWDFYQGGYGLEEVVGSNCDRLKQAYATEKAIKEARQRGFQVQESLKNGQVHLCCTRF